MTVVGFPLIRSRREPCCRRLSSKSCSDCNKNRMRFIPTSFDPGEGAVGSGAKNHGSSTKIGYTLLAPSTDHPHKWFFKVQQQMASYTWQMGCTWLAPSQLGQNWNELFRVQLHMAFHTWHMGYTWLRWYVHADYSHMKPNSTDFLKSNNVWHFTHGSHLHSDHPQHHAKIPTHFEESNNMWNFDTLLANSHNLPSQARRRAGLSCNLNPFLNHIKLFFPISSLLLLLIQSTLNVRFPPNFDGTNNLEKNVCTRLLFAIM